MVTALTLHDGLHHLPEVHVDDAVQDKVDGKVERLYGIADHDREAILQKVVTHKRFPECHKLGRSNKEDIHDNNNTQGEGDNACCLRVAGRVLLPKFVGTLDGFHQVYVAVCQDQKREEYAEYKVHSHVCGMGSVVVFHITRHVIIGPPSTDTINKYYSFHPESWQVKENADEEDSNDDDA